MKPTHKILIGDCRETLKTLLEKSVHCCITSPPYYGLRNYGVDGQLGLESTPDEYVEKLVGAFRQVRRVLRDDGTLWLNMGDSYTEKHLLGMPWRVALALQADGWIFRQDIVWHKPNPMPEAVRDRCTKAHEYIFLFSKQKKYYYDYEAIKEPATYAGKPRGGSKNRYAQNSAGMDCKKYDTRNKRSIWEVRPEAFKGAHYAVFPPKLIEPCVLAGTSEEGCCVYCYGAPWKRKAEGGWSPTCSCYNSPPGVSLNRFHRPIPCTVLDPFGGVGTTAGVAMAHGRSAITCELNPHYRDMMESRIASISEKV